MQIEEAHDENAEVVELTEAEMDMVAGGQCVDYGDGQGSRPW